MHVGFALLTLFPGRVGGSETYVRGLLGGFSGDERLTLLVNRHVGDEYAGCPVPTVSFPEVSVWSEADLP